jgi:aspartyl protease family protein
MDSYDTGRLIYLVLLGSVIASYFLIANRQNLGQMARAAVLWGLIFLGVVAGFGLWSDIRNDVMPRQTVFEDQARIEVPRSIDGHYYLTVAINGTNVPFVVDTGATDIVLSRADAARVGIDLEKLTYTGVAGTANGTVRTARTRVDRIDLGPITDRGVAVWVNQGEMDTSLLGMAYLQRFKKLEISDNTLILER